MTRKITKPKAIKPKQRNQLRFKLNKLIKVLQLAKRKGKKPHKQSPLGRTDFCPYTMTSIVVIKIIKHCTYKEIHDEMEFSSDLRKLLGLKSVPARSTIHDAASQIEPSFLQWFLRHLGRPGIKGDLSGDSSGFSRGTRTAWIGVRAKNGLRKDFLKLHILVAQNNIISSYRITKETCADSPMFAELSRDIPKGKGIITLDSAYLSRINCGIIEDLNRVPFIKPKSNTRNKGFDAMGRMVKKYHADIISFENQYNKRKSGINVFGY